jgi:hypothetical protein
MLFLLAFSVVGGFNSNLYESQEILMYGKYIDIAAPLVLISVICYIFIYENDPQRRLSLHQILSAIVLLGVIFTAFFALSAEVVVQAEDITVSAVSGLYPLRIGVDIKSLITLNTLFLSVSAVFSLMALLIVYISCARRYRLHIISWTIAAIALYSCVYTTAIYLPYMRATYGA